MKRLIRWILVTLQLVLTLICVTTIYDILNWTTENNSNSPNSPVSPKTVYIRKPAETGQLPSSPGKISLSGSPDIPPENSTQAGIPDDSNPASLNDDSIKYPIEITGSNKSTPGFVIVDETGTVYTGLNDMVSAMGWTMLKDGSVFSDEQLTHKIMKFELDDLPNYTIMFKGRKVSIKHPVVNTNGFVVIPLSDLKDLWILDFSIDPVTKSLNLSYTPQ